MRLIIFAGGIGTRLWPLSRRNSPKQFDKIFNNKSTLELAVERVAPVFGYENILIQTVEEYKSIVKSQIPKLPKANIVIEPERRNLGPAVCLATLELQKRNYSGPVAILWADHLMEHVDEFIAALKTSQKLIQENSQRFVFLAERPRFANNNLGWIHVGKKLGETENNGYYKFLGWKYKPEQAECDAMFKSGEFFWNPGYFITSVEFLDEEYKKLAPEIFKAVSEGSYSQAEVTTFDEAIIEKVDLSQAVVLKVNLGWSDPGTLYALKEALQKSHDENITQGQVVNLNSKNCLVYNLENKKLVTTVGLKGTVVVNTKDAIIVVHKNQVKEVTELVKKLEEEGLIKYL